MKYIKILLNEPNAEYQLIHVLSDQSREQVESKGKN